MFEKIIEKIFLLVLGHLKYKNVRLEIIAQKK